MKILAIEKDIPGVHQNDIKPFLKKEAKRVWELYQEGIIREIYFRQDVSNAVLILECNDVNEAVELLNSMPLVEKGLISFEIIPLKPYPGFSRLFPEEH